MEKEGALQLTSLNHISLVCRSVVESVDFYQNVLGFTPIRRPGSFNFDGAWLFSYGIGIHLLQSTKDLTEYHRDEPNSSSSSSSSNNNKKKEINPKDNHISFQCGSMVEVEKKLKKLRIEYIKRKVEEGGIYVDQIFFHDPDGFMIEICNCENLPVITLQQNTMVCKRATMSSSSSSAPPLRAPPMM